MQPGVGLGRAPALLDITVRGEDGAQGGHAVCGLEGCPGGAAASPSGKEPRGGMKEAPRIIFFYGPGARVLTNSGKAWGCLSKIDTDVL